jgi:hypothetical protein
MKNSTLKLIDESLNHFATNGRAGFVVKNENIGLILNHIEQKGYAATTKESYGMIIVNIWNK